MYIYIYIYIYIYQHESKPVESHSLGIEANCLLGELPIVTHRALSFGNVAIIAYFVVMVPILLQFVEHSKHV